MTERTDPLPQVLTVEQMAQVYPNQYLHVKVVSVDSNRMLTSGIVFASGETLEQLAENYNKVANVYTGYNSAIFIYNTSEGFENAPAVRKPFNNFYQ
jgi:hypothetical protein